MGDIEEPMEIDDNTPQIEKSDEETIEEPTEIEVEEKTYPADVVKRLRREQAANRQKNKELQKSLDETTAKLEKLNLALNNKDGDTSDIEAKIAASNQKVEEATRRLLRAEVTSSALEAGFAHPKRVFALMMDEGLLEDVEESDGKWEGLEDKITEFAESNQDLLTKEEVQVQGKKKKIGSMADGHDDTKKTIQYWVDQLTPEQIEGIKAGNLVNSIGLEKAMQKTAWNVAAREGVKLPPIK